MSLEQTILLISVAVLILLYAFFQMRRKAAFGRSMHMTFFKVLIPKKDSDQDDRKDTVKDFKEQISLMEQLLASLKSLYSSSFKNKLFGQDYISFEYVAWNQEIYFYVIVPSKAKTLVEKQITGFYPDAVVEETEEINIFKDKKVVKGVELCLKKPYYYPIKTYQKLESDPINNITSALGKLTENESSVIQILLRPVDDTWQEKVKKIEKKLHKKGGGFLSSLGSIFELLFTNPEDKSNHKDDEHDDDGSIKEKIKKTGYDAIVRVLATGNDEYVTESQLNNIVSSFSQFSSPGSNTLKPDKKNNLHLFVRNYIFRYFSRGFFAHEQILNNEEIASLFHFPHSKYNKTPEIKWQNFKLVKAPVNIPTDGVLLGHNIFRGVKKEIRIKNEDRFRHFYVIGQTGTGKSSILQVMARQDIANGKGICVMDPHGDLAWDLLPFIPRERADDIIYFDPSDLSRPMGINMLEATSDDDKQMVAQDSMNIMIKLFGSEIFGPRIQDYFRNGALTLMDYPGGCALTDIVRLFTDDGFQRERRTSLKNPIVKAWWDYTYAKMGDREKAEIIPYFQAKFGGFITNTLMRNIIGQTKSSFDINEVMQSNKILFINLSKGILGDFNSNLLGLILVSKIQMAAMKRQSIDKAARQDFFLYIDEFQNYITDSIESVLSEARKYRLGLIVAHQYIAQLQKSDALTKSSLNLKDAIFGNVGTIMSYKIGPEDAEFMAKQFAPNFSEQDMINMDRFKSVMKLSVDGQPTPAFSLVPVNPYIEKGDEKLAKAYKELSRLKYGREREFIEKEIIFRIWVV